MTRAPDRRSSGSCACPRHSAVSGTAPIPSPEELDEFDEATAQLRSAWSVLDVASLSEEIVAFLRAANSAQGAPLDSLTEQVREWLEQRGAASHYVIRPADQ